MGYKEEYKKWLESEFTDEATKKELACLCDEKEI